MPFGVTWPQYLKFWAVSITGCVCGSQFVHSIYKPLDNIDKLIEEEAERIRQSHALNKPTFDEKFLKLVQQDQEYKKSLQPKIQTNSAE
ncbi:uncharacterized protein sloth2 [Planococcus citri]|uniref:uncharacterized protein sloth2 n=1 Tax=Planococcus citri TaxID=170843 RepID=UPI0031F8C3B0